MAACTVLVAFVVNASGMKEAQGVLMDRLPNPGAAGHEAIDCWWVAEDERYDGSDNDSAVFVPMGRQAFFTQEVSLICSDEDGR